MALKLKEQNTVVCVPVALAVKLANSTANRHDHNIIIKIAQCPVDVGDFVVFGKADNYHDPKKQVRLKVVDTFISAKDQGVVAVTETQVFKTNEEIAKFKSKIK